MEKEESDVRIDALRKALKDWGDRGYPLLDNSEYREEKSLYINLIRRADRGDKKAQELLEDLEKDLPLVKSSDFDLNGYLYSLAEKYGQFNKEQLMLFFNLLQNDKVELCHPCFFDGVDMIKKPSVEDEALYREKVNLMMDDILSASGKPNEKIAEILKNNPLIIEFSDVDDTHARMETICIDGKIRNCLILQAGLMAKGKEDLLAAIMCHEFGHLLDDDGRPLDCHNDVPLCTECFADMIGYKMCENAGYNPLVHFYNYQKFVEDFAKETSDNQWLGKHYARLDFYKKMFLPEDSALFVRLKKHSR